MTGPLEGRGAVVTGGGRGIGAAIARALVDAGATVLVTARTTAEIERVATELRDRGGRAFSVASDVADEGSVRRMAEAARARLGRVDILVNNAGAASSAPLRRITLAEWQRVLTANATGTFLCTREFAPGMVERGYGRVVNMASVAGVQGGRYVAHYCAAKHAVVGFTRAVAMEMEGTGVTVNAVCPAYVESPLTEHTIAGVQSRAGVSREEALAAVLATTGQQRLIGADEVAAQVLRLCRDDAANLNGETVVIRSGAPE